MSTPAARPDWKEIVGAFLRLGATSYGGPAIMGLMQAELQERRRWVSRERFVEGLALVNMLPGATATQLGIFLGYARGGWRGGLLAGLCFVLPAFCVMLVLTIGYAAAGATPIMRGALDGLGPVILGIFGVAVLRLARSAAGTIPQGLIAVGAAVASIFSPLGVAGIFLLAGAAGLLVFHSRKLGAVAIGSVIAILSLAPFVWWSTAVPQSQGPQPAGLPDLAAYFFKVGAFTVGGGLTMIAFVQDQVVEHFHWLTPQEFVDGLALGQFTPGSVLMLAAYVGYKTAGLAGAAVAAGAVFLPSFILMLALLPMLDRIRALTWTRAVMKGMSPAVIGVLGVSLFRLAQHAVADGFAVAILAATVTALMVWRVGAFKLVVAGSLLGILRTLPSFSSARAARHLGPWVRA